MRLSTSGPVALLFLPVLLAPLNGCQSTERVGRGVDTVVLVESITYKVVAPAPPLLRVENSGDSAVRVRVRAEPSGSEVLSFELAPDEGREEAIALGSFFVVLEASPRPSFVHLSVSVDASQEGSQGEFPGLTIHHDDGN